jgi:acyl-CoA synthetase (AMP-forming)/AMP-acid ligase II
MIGDPPSTLTSALAAACQRWPDRPALVSRHGTLTYGALGAAAERLAVSYGVLGIATGDRVLCSVSNRPELVVALSAAWERGALHVAGEYRLTGPELVRIVERTGARALVYEPPPDAADPLAAVREVRAAFPDVEVVVVGVDQAPAGCHRFEHLIAGEGEAVYDCAPAAEDGAIVFISSGTTGAPKATVGFHGNLSGRWPRLARWLGFGPDDVHLVQLPLSHGFGLMMAVAALLSGGRLVLLERFAVEEALDAIGREGVTVLNGAPTHFRLLLDRLDPARHRVDSLRLSVGTAAAFPAPLVRDVWDRLGVRFMFMYGSSEGIGFATTDREDILLGSVGRAEPGSVLVVDEDRNPLPAGEVGELAFSRRVFPVRYWGDADGVGDGWFYSGDRGRLDEEGRLYIYGRLKHQIDRGGLKVDPVEVETALLATPRVADGAVIGRPDPVLGEVVCACVVPTGEEPSIRLGELRELLGRSLAPHKLPDELHLLAEIPRTPLGKVDLERLRAAVDALPHLVERRRAPVPATR